ncbi:MAG: RHS repeat-associated core domain-containing protein [Planctomycetes bacterium]|nr:RHS repeat-associated core domain-containing protein [Planctomycetota bacterium]
MGSSERLLYSYDKANRLTKVLRDVNDPVAELATPNSETYVNKLEYDMDDVFNLTAYKVTPYGGSTTTTSYTTDAMNQYTAIGGQSPTYTDAGSLKDDGTLLYKYDAHQHLIEVRLKSSNALVAEYAYDALGRGRRITKVVGSDTTRYVYAGQQSIEEWDGTGSGASLRRSFVFGERIDQIVAMEAPDQADVDSDSNTTEVLRFSFHTQLIGSVTQVTGPAGSVVESYEYDPYGKPTMKDIGGSTISASAIGNSYLFTARQLDEETGLYYFRARHYSPELRRFIQRDPLEYVDGPNAVSYVLSNPSRACDPSGLFTQRIELFGPPVRDGIEGGLEINPEAAASEVLRELERRSRGGSPPMSGPPVPGDGTTSGWRPPNFGGGVGSDPPGIGVGSGTPGPSAPVAPGPVGSADAPPMTSGTEPEDFGGGHSGSKLGTKGTCGLGAMDLVSQWIDFLARIRRTRAALDWVAHKDCYDRKMKWIERWLAWLRANGHEPFPTSKPFGPFKPGIRFISSEAERFPPCAEHMDGWWPDLPLDPKEWKKYVEEWR